jgi:hypothetical protein
LQRFQRLFVWAFNKKKAAPQCPPQIQWNNSSLTVSTLIRITGKKAVVETAAKKKLIWSTPKMCCQSYPVWESWRWQHK